MQLQCSWRGAANMGLAAFFRCFSALRLHVSAFRGSFAAPSRFGSSAECVYLHDLVNDLVCSYVLVWCWVRHRFLQFFLIISPAEEEREISGNNAYFQDPLDTQTTKVITRSVMYDSMRAQHRCAAHCIRSAHVALVVGRLSGAY